MLVLDDGSPWAEALQYQLRTEGLPFTRIELQGPGQPSVTPQTLAHQDEAGMHGHFAAIIAPGAASTLLSAAEHQLLNAYQSSFGVRLVETIPTAELGLGAPAASVYRGRIDGAQATVTSEGMAGAFSYLRGTVPIDPGKDADAALLRNPVPIADGRSTPLLTMQIPGTQTQGALIREDVSQGRERLIISFTDNPEDNDVKLLSHGVLRWATRDISVSHFRSWFAVQADDVLLPNSQWSIEGNCEIGRNCPPEIPTSGPDATVRMVPEDVDHLLEWQRANGIKIDQVLNGAGAAQYAQSHGGTDPLTDRLAENTTELRSINHTFTHAFLGCRQILLPDDWRCVDVDGTTQWVSLDTISREVVTNQRFMTKMKLANYSSAELVTGEQSGLRKPPQQPADNPALGEGLTRAGILWLASDASDETVPRRIGSATTVPRLPVDLGYNTPTSRQAVSQYNWRSTSRAAGGSGDCEAASSNDCVVPLDLDHGFAEIIVPMEADKIFDHMITNDPRPHFVHQSNLTSERLLYPILDEALRRRAATYADSVPLLNPSLTDAGKELVDRQSWEADQELVDATVSGGRVRLINQGNTSVRVPVSLPEGTNTVSDEFVTGPFGAPYAGQRSAWVELAPGARAEFDIAGAAGFPADAAWPQAG